MKHDDYIDSLRYIVNSPFLARAVNENDNQTKENKMAKLSYELLIKGVPAKIGDEMWYKDGDWVENIFIIGLFISKKKERIHYKSKNRTGVISIEDAERCLFWEKPIIYQLPDTNGKLSEVNIGQEVYLTEIANNKTKKHKISKLHDDCIYFDDTLFVWNCAGYGFVNFGGVNHLYYRTTTNKPHRDFSGCPHWEENPKAEYWAVDKDGKAYWYYSEPKITRCVWDGRPDVSNSAGYRADLLNKDGVVEDWEYSLVKRPEGV